MNSALLILTLWAQQAGTAQKPLDALIASIARSGRVVEAMPASDRLRDPLKEVAPGQPPLLAFRYFDGADRHRFGKLDLMVDDAGH
ncbi:MAG TPA: hypothetical protein VGL53_07855 [Bryobacteraceae bacterium]|jgi:hypothetical protein